MGLFDEMTSGVIVSPVVDKFLESRGFWKSRDGKLLVWGVYSYQQYTRFEVTIDSKKASIIEEDSSYYTLKSADVVITRDARNSPEIMASLLNKLFAKVGLSSHGEKTNSFNIITSPYVLNKTLDAFLVSRGFKYTKEQGQLGRSLVFYFNNDEYYGTYTEILVRYRTIIGKNIVDTPYREYANANIEIKKQDLNNIPQLVKSLDKILEKLK